MKMQIESAAAQIAREVPVTEACLDDALIQVSTLIKTLVQARRDTGVAASTGQATIARLAKVHAGMDIHECPKTSGASDNVTRLSMVG